MSFDAGSIEAKLTLDPSKFDHDLDRAEARVKAFESQKHEVKISAVFDNSATARARQTFARLDQQLTADALARMRTSPQGSVLGSLNALLAPQSQSLQQGSIGNIAGGTGTAGGTIARDVTTNDRVNVTGDLPHDNEISTLDRVTVEGLPPEHSEITTTDKVTVEGALPSDSDITTTDHVKVEGEVPEDGGTITTTDKIELDAASAAAVKAEADAIGAKKETISVGVSGAPEAAAKLGAVSAAAKATGSSSKGLTDQLGLLATPMGALVTAGVALSPVIITAGVGLGGFGAAAVGAVKPILDAAQATGGLSGNLQTLDPAQQQAAKGLLALEGQYGKFSKALAPEVFAVFNTGLKTASTLLGDVEPVAVSAGKGLNAVLAAVNTDLNSAQWKQFFGFMAQNAGPDIQLLGTAVGAVVDDLPLLLENLQPVGVALLNVATGGAKAFGVLDASVGKIEDDFAHLGDSVDAVGVKLKIPAGNRSILSLAEQWLGVGKAADTAVTAQQQAAAAQREAVTAATDLSTNLTTLEARYGLTAGQAQALVTAAGQTDKALQGSGSSADGAMAAITRYADASLNAASPSQQLAAAISTLDNNTLGATVQLDAFTTAWNILVGNSVTDQQAVLTMASAFDTYSQAVKTSGSNSTTAQTAFLGIITAMGSGLSTLQANGASIDTINKFYQTNIDKLNALHDLTPAERADVQGVTRDYDTWANSTDGLNGKLVTASGTIKDNFTVGLKALGEYTPKLGTDIDNLSNSILKTGTTSSATKGDRAALIKDLENAGLDSQRATDFVDGLEKKIGGLKGKTVDVGVRGSGSGTITFAEQNIKNAQTGFLEFHAMGGPIRGSGGPTQDNIPVMASAGEFMMQTAAVNKYGLPFMEAVNAQKLAAGGPIDISSILGAPDWMGNAMASAAKSAEGADAQLMIADMRAKVAAAAAAAAGTPVAYSKVAGVTQWEPDVLKVLAMLGLPAADLPTVMSQMLTESGGNPNAINLTDSNAAAGTPSKGLMQVIAGTFAAYRSPSLSSNIYDPMANIYAGLNYAIHRYGNPGWLSVLGHGHGYANGGMINEPVLGTGLRSGDRYVLGENGSEMVTPVGGMRGGGKSMDDLAARLDQLHADMRDMVNATRQVPAGVGQHVGGVVNGAAADASFRSRYPRSN